MNLFKAFKGYEGCTNCKGKGYYETSTYDSYDGTVVSTHRCYPCYGRWLEETGRGFMLSSGMNSLVFEIVPVHPLKPDMYTLYNSYNGYNIFNSLTFHRTIAEGVADSLKKYLTDHPKGETLTEEEFKALTLKEQEKALAADEEKLKKTLNSLTPERRRDMLNLMAELAKPI